MKISHFEYLIQEFLLHSLGRSFSEIQSYQFYNDPDWIGDDPYTIMLTDDPMRVDIKFIKEAFE